MPGTVQTRQRRSQASKSRQAIIKAIRSRRLPTQRHHLSLARSAIGGFHGIQEELAVDSRGVSDRPGRSASNPRFRSVSDPRQLLGMVRSKRAVQCSASFGCVVDPFLGSSGFASSIHGICCGGPILASGSGSLPK